MKKNLLLAAVALFIVAGFSSCRKDRTCECTYTDGTVSNTTYHTTKKLAKASCDLQDGNGWTCELK